MLLDTLQISQNIKNIKLSKVVTSKLLWQYVILDTNALKKPPFQKENEGHGACQYYLLKNTIFNIERFSYDLKKRFR